MASNPIQLAASFESLSNEAKEIAAESKEIKAGLIQYFETHPDVQQVGNVKCTRAPKKMPMNPKIICEIIEEEVRKAPEMTGSELGTNIVTRIRNVPEGDVQVKIAIASKKQSAKKSKR